jgi:ubiquinone/menaquinone biosynthesis C-methylase UbiE
MEAQKDAHTVFELQAHLGMTKHLGGFDATEELIALCQIQRGSIVLDVGCGVGATSCRLAKHYGCVVVGVDILERMVHRAQERAGREGVSSRAIFQVADAQALPFEDNQFDVVITESVTAFPADKQQAVNEYRRVVRAGGYVGLNESTWIKDNPPPEVAAWVSQDLADNAELLSPEGWVALMENAGLMDINAKVYTTDTRSSGQQIFKQYGLGNIIMAWGRALGLYMKDPGYRLFIKELKDSGTIPDQLFDYFGYGLYVGRK